MTAILAALIAAALCYSVAQTLFAIVRLLAGLVALVLLLGAGSLRFIVKARPEQENNSIGIISPEPDELLLDSPFYSDEIVLGSTEYWEVKGQRL